jgi:hypothetical protein
MARKSKVSGISVDYDFIPKNKVCGHENHGIFFASIHFHRKNVPTNHAYRIKYYSDRKRIRKILSIADYVYHSPGPYGFLVQGDYYHSFWRKKWFAKFLKVFSWLYWIAILLLFAYGIYMKYYYGG